MCEKEPGPLCIVFDGQPSHESGRFVEVERDGHSINVGQWVERDDGFWELRLHDVCLLERLIAWMDDEHKRPAIFFGHEQLRQAAYRYETLLEKLEMRSNSKEISDG